MKNRNKPLDWAGAKARLEEIRLSLDRAEKPAPEDLLTVYRERARRLKLPETAPETPESAEQFLVFRLGPDRYAIPASMVREVLRDVRIAPVPGAPPSIAGVIQVRGEIRAVYDLGHQLSTTPAAVDETSAMLLLQAGHRTFGMRVDAVEEIRTVTEKDRKQPGQSARVAWVTEDLVSILDSESLWRS
jgi:chemotaxis signal transduction protein